MEEKRVNALEERRREAKQLQDAQAVVDWGGVKFVSLGEVQAKHPELKDLMGSCLSFVYHV